MGRVPSCPICSKKLIVQGKGILLCPADHGTLVTGGYLSDIRKSPSINSPNKKSVSDIKHQITCPNCGSHMQKVSYNNAGIIIDACTECPYRWLDKGEVDKIKKFKPKTTPKDLLFIADVDKQIKEKSQKQTKEANPRLPLQGSWRAGSEILGGFSGHRTEARYGAILGQGLYAIIRGLIYSKTSRYLTLITLLILAVLFYLILLDSKSLL